MPKVGLVSLYLVLVSFSARCFDHFGVESHAPFVTQHPVTFEQNLLQPGMLFRKDTLFIRDTSYHHKWKRATILSACLPGAGQIYNEIGYRKVQNKKHRAWWKVPLIYGGFGAIGYFFYQNLSTARALKAEWIYRDTYGDSLRLYPEYDTWEKSQLINGKLVNGFEEPGFDLAAKRRDILGFAFIAFWGFQVAEALVDGHFVSFDVSEDLSINWFPVYYGHGIAGLNVKMRF